MKYVDTEVVFREIPNEVTLAISISGCKVHCPDCHSKYLWQDIGKELTIPILNCLVQSNKGITCICFMGGNIEEVLHFCKHLRLIYPELHTAWYTGEKSIPKVKNIGALLNYIKTGPYKKEFGGLDSPTTNQVFYSNGNVMNKMSAYDGTFYVTTDLFWKNESKNKEIE